MLLSVYHISMKQLYSFHHDLVKGHIKELEKDGKTIIKSAFIFQLFVKTMTEMNNTSYTHTKIKSSTTRHCAWSGTARHHKIICQRRFGYILNLINANQADINQTKDLLKETHYWNAKNVSELDIDHLFDKKQPKAVRMEILDRMSDKYCKFGIISGVHFHKLYYEVTKLNIIPSESHIQSEYSKSA
jgi:hypothetical protein